MADSIEELYKKVTAERDTHVPKLAAANWMWRDARAWIKERAELLITQTKQLTETDRWPDAAGQAFGQRAFRDASIMLSWIDTTRMFSSAISPNPSSQGWRSVSPSEVFNRNGELITALWSVQAAVEKLRNYYNGLSEEDKGKKRREVETKIVEQINLLAPKYKAAAEGMKNAGGLKWEGPLGAPPRQGTNEPSRGTGPNPAPGNTSSNPSPEAPQPEPANPAENPQEQQDPWKAALEEAPKALDSVSQAIQGLQQLLGDGASPVSPEALPSPGDVGSLSPAEVADRLSGLSDVTPGDSGLPSLAGLGGGLPGGGAGGGGGAGIPAVSPLTNPASSGGLNGTALPPVSAFRTAGTAAATGSPGASSPPMQPQQARGAKPAGEIKPGAAEHAATGRARGRKPGGTPGVSLVGRAGRRGPVKGDAAQPAPAARRRWDAENDTVQLLDEELWQVDQEATPKYRTGH